MFDRLIAGAGSVTDAADRGVRAIARGAGSSVADTRPGSVVVAVVLALVAVMFLLVGLEAGATGGLQRLRAGDVPDDESLGSRIHTTMDGSLASTYVESYTDMDADGVQDDDEAGEAWAYWMVDPTTRSGVTVLSLGSPWEVFQASFSGVVTQDPGYIDLDVPFLEEELGWAGVTLDRTRFVDATAANAGAAHDLGQPLPPTGTAVTITGSRTVTYVVDCSADADGDRICDDEEIDRFDVALFDVDAGTAVLVVTDQDPEFVPVSLTGMLRRDASAVAEAANAPGFTLTDYEISVSPTYVLDVGEAPTDPAIAFVLAGLALLGALVIGLGLAGGYVGYRRSGARPTGASTLAVDEAIPVRVTGVLRSPAGLTHVRDAAAVLRRFVLEPAASAGEPIPLASTIIVERPGRQEGVALGMGELRSLSVGTATTFRGAAPALRAAAGTGSLILAFDEPEQRDRAAAELVAEAGLDLAAPSTDVHDALEDA